MTEVTPRSGSGEVREVSITELRRNLGVLLDEVEQHQTVFAITRYGRRVAFLVPVIAGCPACGGYGGKGFCGNSYHDSFV